MLHSEHLVKQVFTEGGLIRQTMRESRGTRFEELRILLGEGLTRRGGRATL
jgi:hypothetical protein